VLQSAIDNGTRVDVVNIMTFDYYDGVTTRMGDAALHAARALHRQLHRLYPDKSAAELWAMEGNTFLPGIDDYPLLTEVTYPADVQRLVRFAEKKGMGTLAMWAIQRDNGACPGTPDSDSCSGIEQPDWQFTGLVAPFSGPR
jgi:hypothetical protein